MSSGSACTSASLEPSYVLRALGVEEDMVRWSRGRLGGAGERRAGAQAGQGSAARHRIRSRAACCSAPTLALVPSPPLAPPHPQAHTSIRFGLGRFTTEEEVDRAVALTVQHVNKVGGLGLGQGTGGRAHLPPAWR